MSWLSGPRPLGEITVELLDHHGDPLGAPVTLTSREPTAVVSFAVGAPATVRAPAGARAGDRASAIEGAHVRVHDLAVSGLGRGRWDAVTRARVYPDPALDR